MSHAHHTGDNALADKTEERFDIAEAEKILDEDRTRNTETYWTMMLIRTPLGMTAGRRMVRERAQTRQPLRTRMRRHSHVHCSHEEWSPRRGVNG